jgi:hypothetical protein
MADYSLLVDPGICGFSCTVKAKSEDRRTASITVLGSGCSMIRELAGMVREIGFQDIFVPLTRNPVFTGAEKAGCHLACPVPAAIIKAAEAALVLALPKDVSMNFAEVD